MTGCEGDVPDPERRRAANAALTEIIEKVCQHYAPSGARVEDCWEVREDGDGVTLRVFLTGPMQGSWTDAATGARGDALDLVAWLGGLDAAGAQAEAERFLERESARPQRQAGDAGDGQMGLFGALPRDRAGRRRGRRSGKGMRTRGGAQAAEPGPKVPGPDAGAEPAAADIPVVRALQERGGTGIPADRAANPVPASGRPVELLTGADRIAYGTEDRTLMRRMAADVAWLRSRQTVRDRDAEAQGRVKARRERHGRRWRRTGLETVNVLALAAVWLVLGVAVENLYGVSELVAAYGAELAGDVRVLPGGDGG